MSVAKKLAKKSIDEKLLKKLIPLNSLSIDRLRELAEKADIEQASGSRVLFKVGDTTTKTYYLLSGEVDVQLPSGQSFQIKADTPAALHPLAEARPRKATVVIKSSATLLRIDTNLLDILMNVGHARGYEVNEIHTEHENDWMTRFLQSLSVMNIPVKNIEHLIARMEEHPVHAGDTVIRQSEADPQHYFVVKQGRCVVTKQVASGKTPIRVAEIHEGVGFGEEALLARQPRNATVTMLTDGSIMRLNKQDFTQLVAEPAVQIVSYEQAAELVNAGATWIDTRNEADHRHDGIVGSTHIPLSALRLRARELNSYSQYITYCDSGNRATAAAFLLRQLGLPAFALANGLSDIPDSVRHGAEARVANEKTDRGAVVSLNAARHAPAEPVDPAQPPVMEALKPGAPAAVTATENMRTNALPIPESDEASRALKQAQRELESLRLKLSTAHAKEQDLTQRLAQKQSGVAAELQDIAKEQAQLKHRLAQAEGARTQLASQAETLRAELIETRTKADQAARHANEALQRARIEIAQCRDEIAAQKARINDDALNLTSAEAAYESAQQELDGLRRDQEGATREQQADIRKLKAEIAARNADLETVKQQLEREVEKKRAAEEALLTAQREAARLKAEADAARKRAEELARRANESESQQSALMQEVLRKVETAELMRLEAEEQAVRLREAADLSRKRAEEEARRAAEVETARKKALEESERRARMTDEIRRKADEEIARLKNEADQARQLAEEARSKSVAAEAARRKIEEEIQQQPRTATAPAKKAEVPAENELADIEQELARLQEKLESKKRAAVTRQQQRTSATPPVTTANSGEPELLQNVYDIHQKTQKLPAFKQNTDVGKVRKSGWISDSILWETTIGMRDDEEAEKELGAGREPEARNPEPAPAPVPAKPRIEPSMRAMSSGEIRAQEAKRSVFTSREAAPTSSQRRIDVPQRSNNTVAIILAVFAGIAVVVATYLSMNKPETTNQQSPRIREDSVSVPAMNSRDTTLETPAKPAMDLRAEPPANINGAILRKETTVADPVTKPKRETKSPAAKISAPAKPIAEAEVAPAEKSAEPKASEQRAELPAAPTAPGAAASTTSGSTVTPPSAAAATSEPQPTPTDADPDEEPTKRTTLFTDKATVN